VIPRPKRRRARVASLLVAALVASGCGLSLRGAWPWLRPRAAPPSADRPAPAVSDEETLPWAAEEPYFVVARLGCRTLDVYRHGKRIRSYEAVFGMGGEGKQWEGDRRTPLGLYTITRKMPHPRWQHFFLLDYPNATDRLRWQKEVDAHEVPEDAAGEPLGPGGQVGIHGTDKPDENRRGIDWTFGCISVEPSAIEDLAHLLPLGTPVLIRP
jgi:murein L,D-transpeptidase YafK